jgi:hypothetical protein
MYEKDGLYYCGVCKTAYETPLKAVGCEKTHDQILVSFSPSEIQSLLTFILTRNNEYLEPTAWIKLQNALSNFHRAKKGI